MKLLARASALLTTVLVAALLTLVPIAPAHAAINVFPLPTSDASPGRIVTAPNGDMWFTEDEVNQIARITPQGVITEYALPPTTTGEGTVQDLDIGPDGTIWVVYDTGWNALRINPDLSTVNYDLFGYPYGGKVRVGPGGIAFVTMNYDESGVARMFPTSNVVDWADNAPECEDTLGKAADGSMWCSAGIGGQLVHLNATATGGVTYPLPSDATYVNGLAAGPVGSIWFTRSSSGSWLTSRNDGSIGYLDAATGATQIWKTGYRTAPRDLIQAPDGTMWFTNGGASPAIGHINAQGVGEITAVGNYSPLSLTWGKDNAIWFTDATNNAIVRVTPDELQTTNIDVGSGATMVTTKPPGTPPPGTPGIPAPPTLPPAPAAGTLSKVRGVVPVKRTIPVVVVCPATATQGCSGALRVAVGKKAVTKSVSYKVAGGAKAKVKAKLTAKGKRLLKPGRKVKVTATLTAVGAAGPGWSETFRVRRK